MVPPIYQRICHSALEGEEPLCYNRIAITVRERIWEGCKYQERHREFRGLRMEEKGDVRIYEIRNRRAP